MTRATGTGIVAGVALAAWVASYVAIGPLSRWIAFGALGLAPGSRLGESIAFFLYDTPKVLLLLALIVFVIGVVRSFFTAERARAILAGKRESVGNVLAASLGIVTPFCSCSAVPLFIGFVEAGIPLGVTLSFLISAPMINEVALVLLFGLFGWKVAALYLVTGLTVAVASGYILGRLKLERFVGPKDDTGQPAPLTPDQHRRMNQDIAAAKANNRLLTVVSSAGLLQHLLAPALLLVSIMILTGPRWRHGIPLLIIASAAIWLMLYRAYLPSLGW